MCVRARVCVCLCVYVCADECVRDVRCQVNAVNALCGVSAQRWDADGHGGDFNANALSFPPGV